MFRKYFKIRNFRFLKAEKENGARWRHAETESKLQSFMPVKKANETRATGWLNSFNIAQKRGRLKSPENELSWDGLFLGLFFGDYGGPYLKGKDIILPFSLLVKWPGVLIPCEYSFIKRHVSWLSWHPFLFDLCFFWHSTHFQINEYPWSVFFLHYSW